jgi:hypothetical protein
MYNVLDGIETYLNVFFEECARESKLKLALLIDETKFQTPQEKYK